MAKNLMEAEFNYKRLIVAAPTVQAVRMKMEMLEAKIAGYRSQLSAYGDAVAEMFTIPREGVSLELLFVDRGEVVVLGSP